MKFQIFIYSKEKVYQPIIEGMATIQWERNFRAGTLQFNVVKDDVIDYHEGDRVTFNIDGEVVFQGYVFSKRRSKTQIIETLCYDSLRYLKSQDTYQYKEQSMSDLIKKICEDRGLPIGEIEDTNYKIPKKIEQNQEYLNMIKSADDITLSQTGNIFTLFDDKGKISLKSPQNMFVDYPVTYDNAVDFRYETSIDNGTYNRVVVYITDDDGNELRKVIKEDKTSIKEWGVLEYTVVTNNDEDIENKASQLLEILNRKYRSLQIKDIIGNVEIRAGSLIPVRLMAIGDININSLMLVNSVTHRFMDDYHFMDLDVFNKDIMPMGNVDGIIQDKPKQKEVEEVKTNIYGDKPKSSTSSSSTSSGGTGKTSSKMVRPTTGRITSNFGNRIHPIKKTNKFHAGIDIAAPTGTAVKSVQGGKITYAGRLGGYGNVIYVDHPDGTQTRYAHLSKINVKKGQLVDSSQLIGAVGSTGYSTGSHLHFEVRKGGKAVNPRNYVKF